jgi:hypothetical protein
MLAAPVRGLAAAVLAPVLAERLAVVEAAAATGRVDPSDLPEVRAAFAAIRRAGREYVDWLATAGGSAEVPRAEAPPRSAREVSSEQAAEALGVSARRVRQMCAAGVLDSRKVAGVWVVDRTSLESYRDVRSVA